MNGFEHRLQNKANFLNFAFCISGHAVSVLAKKFEQFFNKLAKNYANGKYLFWD